MTEVNQESDFLDIKRFINRINFLNPLITFLGVVLAIAISFFLLSKCFNLNSQEYQSYQDQVLKIQNLDANFNQAVLKSRYELYTSYDPLVRNLQQQRSLLKRIAKPPQFINLEAKEPLNNALKEINTSLQQKIELSDRFKSRNALLKNSLRYLPLLTNQLESRLSDSNQNLTLSQRNSLGSNLNKLTRQLLIYNVAADQKNKAEIESLSNDLLQLQIEYSLTPQELPIDIFTAHTNIILNTKPQVEELTSRLVTPITEKTEVLKEILQVNYQRVRLITNIYQIITAIWFLLLLILLNQILLRKSRIANPQFAQYKQKVSRIAEALTEALAVESNLEVDNNKINSISNIIDLASSRDDLGNLANGVIKISNQIQREKIANLESESLAFLTARLTLVTRNNQKLFNPEMVLKLKVILEIILDGKDCQLIELQEAKDRIQLLFRYPARIRLSKLIQNIKTESYQYFQQEFPDLSKNLADHSALWADAYLITSCDSDFLNNNQSDRLLVEK